MTRVVRVINAVLYRPPLLWAVYVWDWLAGWIQWALDPLFRIADARTAGEYDALAEQMEAAGGLDDAAAAMRRLAADLRRRRK